MARTIKQPRKEGFIHSKGFKVTLIIVGILVVLFVASEIAIPLAADAYIKGKLKEKYPSATDISVSVGAFPEFMLAFKKYSHLDVEAGSITIENINLNSMRLTSKAWPMARCEAFVKQDEINRVFAPKSGLLMNPAVTLDPNTLRVSGQLRTTRLLDVEAVGTARVRNGRYVYFDAAGVSSPQKQLTAAEKTSVINAISQNPIFLIRENLPFTITSITVEDGLLHITGAADMEKVLNIHL